MTLRAQDLPPQQVVTWWSPGEPEDDMHGFVYRDHRDAHDRGAPGPFLRVLRDPALGPVPMDVQATREYLDGTGRFKRHG